MEQLQLVEANPYYGSDLKSTAMEIAGQLREEGYSPSEALSEGWARAKEGYDRELYEQLDIPYDNPKPKRRQSTEFEPSNFTWLLVLGAGYLGWAWWASARKGLPWTWQPWKGTLTRRLLSLPRHTVSATALSYNSYESTPVVSPAKNSSEPTIRLVFP